MRQGSTTPQTTKDKQDSTTKQKTDIQNNKHIRNKNKEFSLFPANFFAAVFFPVVLVCSAYCSHKKKKSLRLVVHISKTLANSLRLTVNLYKIKVKILS
jgi:hypothetical protein